MTRFAYKLIDVAGGWLFGFFSNVKTMAISHLSKVI